MQQLHATTKKERHPGRDGARQRPHRSPESLRAQGITRVYAESTGSIYLRWRHPRSKAKMGEPTALVP
jgi:hypothetical protein